MDCFGGKKKCKQCEKGLLAQSVRLLQEEINAMMCEREKERRAYERDLMVLAFKEAEWKQERKTLKEDVKRMRKMLEEKEEKIRGMEDNGRSEKSDKNWLCAGTTTNTTTTSSFLMEKMREERLWRDEAVDKWKKLYLAIKTELDDLIQRTHRGDGLYWRAEEEDIIEELKLEVKAKEETIEALKARLASVEHEEYKRAREVDILRQSLRIVSSKKGPSSATGKSKSALVKHVRKA